MFDKDLSKNFKLLGVLIIIIGVCIIFSDIIYNQIIKYYRDKAIKGSEIVVNRSNQTDVEYYDETGLVDGSNFVVSEDQDIKQVDSYKNVIEIENLGIKAYVYDDLSHDSLIYGVGRYPDTPKLGESGNTVIAGHSSNIYNCILNNLKDIKIFDTVNVYNDSGDLFKYYVTDKYIINPNDLRVLDTVDESIKELTIITCTSNGAQRLIVKAKQLSDSELVELKENVQIENKEKLLTINSNLKLFDFKSIFKERNKPIKLVRKVDYIYSPFNRVSTLRNMNLIIKNDLVKKEHSYNPNFDISFGFKFELKE